MKLFLNICILALVNQAAMAGLFRFEITSPIGAGNTCTFCAADIHLMIEDGTLSTRHVRASSSFLVVQKAHRMTDISEHSAIGKLQSRILFFTPRENSYAAQLIYQSRQTPNLTQKLYYQLSLENNGKGSSSTERSKPIYEVEKEIPHELWGYYQVIDGQAYVFINEFQNFWNADYSLIHELSHIFDSVTGEYLEKLKSAETPIHALDDVAIEFRTVLAEVTYRKDVVSSRFFEGEVLIKDDFRDELMPNKTISNERVLNFVLDLFYPIKFKKRTTQQLAGTSGGVSQQNRFIFEVMDEFFRNAIEKMKKYTQIAETLGLSYKTVDTDSLAEANRKLRDGLIAEAQRRGASDLIDYLVKNNLTQPLSAATVRSDGRFNQWPNKTGGPSPRGGGGSP